MAGLEPAEAAGEGPEASALDVQLLRRLADQARDQGLELTGDGGLLQQLTKMLLESALEGEMDGPGGVSSNQDREEAERRAVRLSRA